jgi:hypothetical protein
VSGEYEYGLDMLFPCIRGLVMDGDVKEVDEDNE